MTDSGFKTPSQLWPVHGSGLELPADKVAAAIQLGRGCRQEGLAGRFTRSQARIGQNALDAWLSLEPAAGRVAASVREV